MGCDVDHPVRHSAAGQAAEEGREEGGGGGTPPPHSAVQAVLGYDTTGDGRPDAFDTNQDGRLDTVAAAAATGPGASQRAAPLAGRPAAAALPRRAVRSDSLAEFEAAERFAALEAGISAAS